MLKVKFGQAVARYQWNCLIVSAFTSYFEWLFAFTVPKHVLMEESFLQKQVSQELLFLLGKCLQIVEI